MLLVLDDVLHLGLGLIWLQVLLLWQSCEDIFLLFASHDQGQFGLVHDVRVLALHLRDLFLAVHQLD